METRQIGSQDEIVVNAKSRVLTPLPPIPLDVVKICFNKYVSFSMWQFAAKTNKAFNKFINAELMPTRLHHERSLILPQLIVSCLCATVSMAVPRNNNNGQIDTFNRLLHHLNERKVEYDVNPTVDKYESLIKFINYFLDKDVCKTFVDQVTYMYDQVVFKTNEDTLVGVIWNACFQAYVNVVVRAEMLITYLRELPENRMQYEIYLHELNTIMTAENLLLDRCRAQFIIDIMALTIKCNAEASFKVIFDSMPIIQFSAKTLDNNILDYKEFLFGFFISNIGFADRECFRNASGYVFRKYQEILQANEANFIVEAENNKIFYNPLYIICHSLCYKDFSSANAILELEFLEQLAVSMVIKGESLVCPVYGDETSLSLIEKSLAALEETIMSRHEDDLFQPSKEECILEEKRLEIMRRLFQMHYDLQHKVRPFN